MPVIRLRIRCSRSQAGEDDWHAYLIACMEAVRAKYFPKPAPAAIAAKGGKRSNGGTAVKAHASGAAVAQAAAALQREDTAYIEGASQPATIAA
jgi:hypothetical protein